MSDEKRAFFVEACDGRKFKMVIKGDLGKLSVAKIRRYLKSYGMTDDQVLTYRNTILTDNMLGEDFGLEHDALLHLFSAAKSPLSAQVNRNYFYPGESALPSDGVKKLEPETEKSSWHSAPALASAEPVAPVRAPEAWMNMGREGGPSGDRSFPEPALSAATSSAAYAQLKLQVEQLQAEKKALESQLALYNTEKAALQISHDKQRNTTEQDRALRNARENLRCLSECLQLPLAFDDNFTCVIGTDEDFSILITFDRATERLYLYSSILTTLPENETVRVKLYEVLLEGSLLGREVCGGGIGISLQSGLIVLATSILTAHCDREMLKEVVPTFVEALKRWRSLIEELVQ